MGGAGHGIDAQRSGAAGMSPQGAQTGLGSWQHQPRDCRVEGGPGPTAGGAQGPPLALSVGLRGRAAAGCHAPGRLPWAGLQQGWAGAQGRLLEGVRPQVRTGLFATRMWSLWPRVGLSCGAELSPLSSEIGWSPTSLVREPRLTTRLARHVSQTRLSLRGCAGPGEAVHARWTAAAGFP